MLSCIWMAITAPINSDMIITRGMESTPNFEISAMVRLKNTFHLSGMENTRLMNRQYRPKVVSDDVSIMLRCKRFLQNDGKVSHFAATSKV